MTNLIFLISQKILAVHTYHSERIQAGVLAKNITDVFLIKLTINNIWPFLKVRRRNDETEKSFDRYLEIFCSPADYQFSHGIVVSRTFGKAHYWLCHWRCAVRKPPIQRKVG